MVLPSPPPMNRAGFWRPRKNSATTPPPTEPRRILETTEKFCHYPPPLNRVDLALHTKENPGSATDVYIDHSAASFPGKHVHR